MSDDYYTNHEASAPFHPRSSSLWNALGDQDPVRNGTSDRDQTHVHICTTYSLNDSDYRTNYQAPVAFHTRSSLWNALGDQALDNGIPDRDQTQVSLCNASFLDDGNLEEVFEDEGLDSDEPQACMHDISDAQAASLATPLATCPRGLCLWCDPGVSDVCNTSISCQDVPTHFRVVHGIKRIKWDQPRLCSWDGCNKTIQRKFFVRHVRECHLDHPRQGHH